MRPCSQSRHASLRVSSPISASEESLARPHERAAKPRGAEERPPPPRSRVIARLASLAQIEELARRLRHTSGGVAK